MASAVGLGYPRRVESRRQQTGNIVSRIRQGQVTGRGLCRGTQIPEALLYERDKKAKWHGIPVLLQKLYENSHPNCDLSQVYGVIKEISSLLSMEAMAFVTEDRKTAQESTYPNTYTFDLFGGVDLLVEILMRPTLTAQKNKLKVSDELVKDCLSVLYNCCICTESITKSLAARNEFVLFLFTLMTNKKTFLQTATLIEDILGVKKEMIQLEDIPDLPSLVQRFDQQQLANFCRILSVTISELDVGNDDKHTLLAKNAQQKKNSSPSRAEINQETVDESTLMNRRLPQSMKIVHEIMYKVEVLYVLCVLLMGRQRNQVHKMLAEFKLIPGLNSLFEKLIWRKQTNHVLHGQNQSCDCSPDISLKIQFLRLLQSFSDHHENKYLLLNRQELNELSAISLKANIPEVEALVNTDRNLVCEGKKGLLTRLLTVMKREPVDSSFRFWQARAVESFLRGVTSYADQMFLLKRGLLEHILFCIIDSKCKSRDVLQSYFDLLGELMKFNIDAFKIFNKYVNTDEKENVSCLNTSLVILMLARRKGKLPFYLNALREKEYAEKYPGCLLNNFHNLLRFWQQHYLNKDKDSTCLENSSCISFSYWKETVSVLLNCDRTSPSAIASYIDEAYMDIDRDFMED
ncbi:TP4AP protein, partial [Polypterus senegalus]